MDNTENCEKWGADESLLYVSRGTNKQNVKYWSKKIDVDILEARAKDTHTHTHTQKIF
jgi:hypothetical protein